MRTALYAAATLLCLPATALADVRLPHILSDHMVLQAGQPVPVWGWADPGEAVTVRFAQQTKHTTADAAGHWQVTLKPLTRTAISQDMIVKGHNSLDIADILVGEVWLASGQSNMEKPLGEQSGQKPTLNYQDELKAANVPDIRLFKVRKTEANTPATDVDGVWIKCDPASLEQSKFSAAGYFFGRKLHDTLNTPVGMIDSTWGGTRIEPWTPPSGFAGVPSLSAYAEAAKTPGAKVEDSDISILYNGMIAPLIPFSIKGVIWYQGESNIIGTDDGARYADKMTALVQGWRGEWKTDFSFYYVQVAPHLYHIVRPTTVVDPQAEPRLWEAQTASLRLPKTGMVVVTDLVDDLFDIHPRNKKDVGERLARWALSQDYAQPGIIVSGPLLHGATFADGKATLSFDYVASGLVATDGKALTWFDIAGKDGRFYPASATIDGDHVVVASPKVPDPAVVHFAWDEGAQPNFSNKDGLPAVPFRTDNPFKAATQ